MNRFVGKSYKRPAWGHYDLAKMGHREILLSLRTTLDQLPPNRSRTTRVSVRRTAASFKSTYDPSQQSGF
jgi:hypothetical protein